MLFFQNNYFRVVVVDDVVVLKNKNYAHWYSKQTTLVQRKQTSEKNSSE